MYKLGFNNFRKFSTFNPVEYRGITFLVGSNNSGKSTFVKAFLLINNFIKSENYHLFSFVDNIIDDVNIITLGRARNNNSTSNSPIDFIIQLEHFQIIVSISGDDYSTIGIVQNILIDDILNGYLIKIDPINEIIGLTKKRIENKNESKELNKKLNDLENEIIKIEHIIETTDFRKSSKDYISILEERDILYERKKRLLGIFKISKDPIEYTVINSYGFEPKNEVNPENSFRSIFNRFFSFLSLEHDKDFNEIQKGYDGSDQFVNNRAFIHDQKQIQESIAVFDSLVKYLDVHYLGNESIKQHGLFTIRNNSSLLAVAVHDYFQLKILPGTQAYMFVRKWMKVFDVGDDFTIQQVSGEAYEFKIISGKKSLPLADKGMGSIQITFLLIRLASIIHKRLNRNYIGIIELYSEIDVAPLIIIEEPELNLHPRYQSILADLFYEVNTNYGFKFIIETHSEYLIRKTQLIVKEKELEIKPNINPFSVIYFDTSLQQWNMEYREDGVFKQDFGPGFFDVSSQQAMKLLRKRKD